MAKYNGTAKRKTTKTKNLAGGNAYKVSDKMELVSLLLTSFAQNQYYRTEKETESILSEMIQKFSDKKFIAKTAIFARKEFGMRSITHAVAGEIVKHVKGEPWVRPFIKNVINRVDDITEILSYYISRYNKPIPNSLKRGLGDALGMFNEYELAKYKSDSKSISLVDAVNLIHPIPTETNKIALEKLIKGELKSFDTWESELSQAGQKSSNDEEKEQFKKEVWIRLIKEKKIGYFALLRNIRNVIEQAPEIADEMFSQLTNPESIKKSLVLPFRFTTAFDNIKNTDFDKTQSAMVALNRALEHSVSNVPMFQGKTCVLLDESGSMSGKPWDIGSLFAAILLKSNDADLILFSDKARHKNVNKIDSIPSIIESFERTSGGTDLSCAIKKMNKKYDRIIVLSDMQTWVETVYSGNSVVECFSDYKKKYDANPFVYSWDLQGYGTIQFPEDKIFFLAGFSEKIFSIMNVLEQNKNVLINEIEKINL